MWKSWQLITKLGACVALFHHLHHPLLIRVNKSSYCFGTSESSVKNEFENQCNLQFSNHENCCGIIIDVVFFFFNFIYLFFWLLLKFFFGGYSRKFLRRQCKIQFSRGNLREQKVLESAFSSFQGALKSKILATMVPPPGHIGYITNNKPLVLSYWELERMLSTTIVFSFNGLIWKTWYPLIALFFQVSFMIMKIM